MTNAQQPSERRNSHRLPLLAALAVVVLSLVVTVSTHFTGHGKVTRTIGVAAQERMIYFRDGRDGTVIVSDAQSRKVIARFGRGEGAFVRQSMRALSHNRLQQGVEKGQYYQLVQTAKGKLSIVDPVTGRFIKLNAFGKVAMDGFSQLLLDEGGTDQRANAIKTSEKGA